MKVRKELEKKEEKRGRLGKQQDLGQNLWGKQIQHSERERTKGVQKKYVGKPGTRSSGMPLFPGDMHPVDIPGTESHCGPL